MNKSKNICSSFRYLINKAVSLHNKFTDKWIIKFGNYSTSFRQISQ